MEGQARKVSVIGLGYVGLPVAAAFGRVGRTIAFDINEQRVAELRQGVDRTGEVEASELAAADLFFTSRAEDLKAADLHIVAVPTPVDEAHRPELGPLLLASAMVGKILKRGDIVVFESTVYPGATEDDCVPVLEKHSGLRMGRDFSVGYSPERINPGDKQHSFTRIKKVVSGSDAATLEIVARTYESVVSAGVHRARSIKVAEAAKVIENTQRDLNIALMNELALIFDLMGIDTLEVLEAAGTKWNFLNFRPGLVGGHCIGVDPYYLTHKAEQLGYISQVILAGRRINDSMGRYIAQKAVKELVRAGHNVVDSTITVLGITFKENCRDLRNSRVIDIVAELRDYGIRVQLHDPLADAEEAEREQGVKLTPWEELKPAHAVIAAVAHDVYRSLDEQALRGVVQPGGVLIDVKGVFDPARVLREGLRLWRL
jgi:UDP-N-acetyl-D-glucosamine/UDP-N-acetyl-D-galactosamine dehydrogenase